MHRTEAQARVTRLVFFSRQVARVRRGIQECALCPQAFLSPWRWACLFDKRSNSEAPSSLSNQTLQGEILVAPERPSEQISDQNGRYRECPRACHFDLIYPSLVDEVSGVSLRSQFLGFIWGSGVKWINALYVSVLRLVDSKTFYWWLTSQSFWFSIFRSYAIVSFRTYVSTDRIVLRVRFSCH